MNKCALCGINDANKKNTHFLSDNIIRRSLNYDGSNGREKGLYYDFSSNTHFVEFNFQRNASEYLTNQLGRDVTEKEIEKSKSHVPFSVDNVFCSQCENNVFCEIENRFNTKILPQFRNSRVFNTQMISISDVQTIRLFFYLQLWRCHVCDSRFPLSPYLSDCLKSFILCHSNSVIDDISCIPMSVYYLETMNSKDDTENLVGYPTGTNPYVIFMSDFMVQIYDSMESIKFDPILGFNQEHNFKSFINYNEQEFQVRIIADSERSRIIKEYSQKRAKKSKSEWIKLFLKTYFEKYKTNAPADKLNLFDLCLANREFSPDKYSEKKITELIAKIVD